MKMPPHSFPLLLAASFSLLAMPCRAELDLKTVADESAASAEAKKKKQGGAHIGFFGGATYGQEGRVESGTRSFSFEDTDGSAIFGIEVGKSWRAKRLPIEFSLDFEATYTSTELRGQSADARLAANGTTRLSNDLVAYRTDMNALMFSVNGTIAADLWRYRARIGKVLAGFKPYIGAGIGGGQTWFRNATSISRDAFRGVNPNLAARESVFAIDEFVNYWNWYAGLQWTWEDKYSVYFEYRDMNLGDLDNLKSFGTDGYVLGMRYRY
ncbi:MAG: hypothetical protein JNG86_22135 [Verrucomicrobiaceae bacterium]|nr:hypothetical protein [Verrucomicrobiaceae bacterium]